MKKYIMMALVCIGSSVGVRAMERGLGYANVMALLTEVESEPNASAISDLGTACANGSLSPETLCFLVANNKLVERLFEFILSGTYRCSDDKVNVAKLLMKILDRLFDAGRIRLYEADLVTLIPPRLIESLMTACFQPTPYAFYLLIMVQMLLKHFATIPFNRGSEETLTDDPLYFISFTEYVRDFMQDGVEHHPLGDVALCDEVKPDDVLSTYTDLCQAVRAQGALILTDAIPEGATRAYARLVRVGRYQELLVRADGSEDLL